MSEEIKLGPAIKNAIKFLDSVYEDTSKFLQIVEQTMTKKGMVSFWGAYSVWGRSAAFNGPSGWLVHYLNRVYKPKDPAEGINLFAFVNVYFSPDNFDQPVVVYGKIWHKLDCRNEPDARLFNDIWGNNFQSNWGVSFIDNSFLGDAEDMWKEYVPNAENPDDTLKAVEKVQYKIKLLTAIDDQVKAEKICNEIRDL